MPAVKTWAAFGQMWKFPGVISTAGWVLCSEHSRISTDKVRISRTVDLELSHMREVSAEDAFTKDAGSSRPYWKGLPVDICISKQYFRVHVRSAAHS